MENIYAFIEITAKEKRIEFPMQYISASSMRSTNFMTAVDNNSGTEIVKYINEQMDKGYYDPDTKYAILYLYDLEDTVSFDMLYRYGGRLHQDSSANLAILTYFDKTYMNGWTDVQFKNRIETCDRMNDRKVNGIIKNMQSFFNVERLPAMVILKKTEKGQEHFNLGVYNKNAKGIYDLFGEVINTIIHNCNKDLSVIEELLTGNETEQAKIKNGFSVYDFVENLISNENKHKCYFDYSLANEMYISDKALYCKRTGYKNAKFKRDECLFLAVRFNIENSQLESLLQTYHYQQLAVEGRDAIIREAFYDKWDIEELEDELIRNGYLPLINRNKKNKKRN